MAERTKRGDEDRKREDEDMKGEPVGTAAPDGSGAPTASTTRDKGQEPVKDVRREGRGAEED
ncbi:hypothetical protein GobsT_02560 [Gemmata obscuriglobus]|uniref:Uncharacterized protein n=1 Tax=Gemmata obscuriglobus TaxID=114 RepID=A0A2Z3HBM1_9BACT|nr:hypothetical protein [Gemmata obscuriglobus]AWM41136.1 hypothetical protein C1280_31875 [Gemmata obscuriglobus]QEG25529.1 hypothetical protein GobsT_02560 [Gemmata obscuriglobus]VTR98856.1 unnamed protein product [Gemmata obscuriglobus UQM 2246]